jgi:ATP-dependent Clp protease ATP-binding subunit ClpA
MAMFERFEPGARQAFVDAREEASRTGQGKIGSEHLLVGLLREPGPAADALTAAGLELGSLRARLPRRAADAGPAGLDAHALASLGIDLDAVRRATEAAFGPGALEGVRLPGERRLPFADDTRQSLVGAVRQAQQLRQQTISSGHMLIGILDQDRSGALTVLSEAGTDVAALRADVLRRITA